MTPPPLKYIRSSASEGGVTFAASSEGGVIFAATSEGGVIFAASSEGGVIFAARKYFAMAQAECVSEAARRTQISI